MKPMTNAYYTKLFALINIIYRKIFHEEVSIEVEKFIKNISYVGIGTIVASIFSFSYNILAGRWLGPSEYGTFTLIQSVAMFLYIPMLLGFHTAMVKYNAEKIDFPRQRCIVSTTYILVVLFTTVSILIYYIFSKELATIFSISDEGFYFAVLFAVVFVFYTLTTETLRSLHMIRDFARLKPLISGILFFTFLVLALMCSDLSFKSPLLSMLLAYGITGGVILVIIRKYLRPELNGKWVRKLHRYSVYSLMGGISFVFYTNIDKLLIKRYLSATDVGAYSAYHYSFTSIIMLLITIFVTVFFPIASQSSNKWPLFQKVNKLALIIIILSFPLILISGNIILHLYGTEYTFDLYLAILFTLLAIVVAVNQAYGQLMASIGEKGIKIMSLAAISMAIINVSANIMLIPIWGLNGAVISTIISYIISTGIILSRKSYFKDYKAL